MGFGSEFILERFVFILDVIRRRWILLCLPVALAVALAALSVKLAPTKYVANSLILLQGANRSAPGFGTSSVQRMSALEQIGAVEAWLKSDQVLADLLPQLAGYSVPQRGDRLVAEMNALRAALTLELVGGSVLEVKLEGRSPAGLGRNLEIIVSRLMEGLTGPEQNIFSASQFVLMRRREELAATDAALTDAIAAAGLQAPLKIRADLKRLWVLTQPRGSEKPTASENGPAPLSKDAADRQYVEQMKAAGQLRRTISDDPMVVADLERRYAALQAVQVKYDAIRPPSGAARSNYVGIFDAPDNLLIIGRPEDPIVGESVARKLAIAGILLSLIGGAGIVFLVELFGGVLRTRREHEAASGLPVVARLADIPSSWRPGRL